MSSDTTTSRRALLKAAPVAAVAVAMPAVAIGANTTDLAGWQQAKASFLRSLEGLNTLIDVQSDAEGAAWSFKKAAPKQTFTYTERAREYGWFRTDAYETSVDLHAENWSEWSKTFQNDPEYAAFGQRIQAWQDDPAYVEARNHLAAVREAVGALHNAEDEAWRHMIAFPLHDLTTLADKSAIGRSSAEGDEQKLAELLEQIEADVQRIAGGAHG